jgi:hypothetical protein
MRIKGQKKGQKISSDSKPLRVPMPIIEELDLERKIQDFREDELRKAKGLPLRSYQENYTQVIKNDD